MIRNLLATTAIATLVATGAFAQDATTPAPAPADPQTTTETAPAMKGEGEGNLATLIIGEQVYNGTGDDAEKNRDDERTVSGHGKVSGLVPARCPHESPAASPANP